MVRLTVSGQPGSGTSTLVDKLCQHFGWSALNGGQVFRDAATDRGMELLEFGKLCKEDLSVDRELDAILKQRMQTVNGPEINESRLAGWWAYELNIDCVRLWIEVSVNERARRIVAREGGSIEQRLQQADERMATDQARFAELYGFQPADEEPYNASIDGTNLDADQVFDQTIALLDKRGITNG